MDSVDVKLPESVWRELVSLGREEAMAPDRLLERAVRHYLDARCRRSRAREALRVSFGVWQDRGDLEGDSATLVKRWREEWDEREQRLGLAQLSD